MCSPAVSLPRVLPSSRQLPWSSAERNRPSQRPPLAVRKPTSRAGMTRVSLMTRQSPRAQQRGQVANMIMLEASPRPDRPPAGARRLRRAQRMLGDQIAGGNS